METTPICRTLDLELNWLERKILAALRGHMQQRDNADTAECAAPPDLSGDSSSYAAALRAAGLDAEERLILILALAPAIRPQALDAFLVRNPATDRGFTEFGGERAAAGFAPTVETALFVASGGNLERRLGMLRKLQPDAPLCAQGFLQPPVPDDDGAFGQRLRPDPNCLAEITTGQPYRPVYGPGFPAKRLTTALAWDDLVLPRSTMNQVGEVLAWLEHGATVLGDARAGRMLKPGFRSLFHGPPGTGKTLTATLLGKQSGRDVYRVDLSLPVSKWIGETEKNLANVFARARRSGWLLLFDEADALFGKRTAVRDANDRYANQELGYLLQRLEDFDGVAIVATNLEHAIDSASARRFQSTIRFPLPGPDERRRLWGKALPDALVEADVDVAMLAADYELTGGDIVGVLRHCLLAAHRDGRARISAADIRAGIRRELRKAGRAADVRE